MLFRHYLGMFIEIYIEALLVDEDLADQVWGAMDKGEIDNMRAYRAWPIVAGNPSVLIQADQPSTSAFGE